MIDQELRDETARAVGISDRLLAAAERVGCSPAQAKEFAEWFSSLDADERASLVKCAAEFPARTR